jgi:hypothetical protein
MATISSVDTTSPHDPQSRLVQYFECPHPVITVGRALYFRFMTRDAAEILGHPEDLPAAMLPYWPDLNRWPTLSDVRRFRRLNRQNPAAKLAVLNGLRSWSEIDITPIWSWAGALIAVLLAGIGGSIVAQIQWVQLLVGAVTIALAIVFLVKLASLSSTADKRRRGACVWLHALE